jgi:RHS repeat-associated protein
VEGIDQPVGLIRPEGTRVLNYTWRGLGESSVFVNGTSGDCAIFFTGCVAVEWPATAQGAVYYTPNLVGSTAPGPYTWFGSLAANGAGSSGLLYRRNRYFDPVSGRFTQQDPIGVAGGMNLYGFGDGDPINFSDPFGLCVDKDINCQNLVRMLRAQGGSEFRAAADRYDSQKTGRVFFYSRRLNTSRRDALNVDGDPSTYQLGNTRGKGGDVYLRGDVSTADFLVTAVHESVHLAGDMGEAGPSHAAYRAFRQLSPGDQRKAIFNSNIFFQSWGAKYGSPLPAGVTESRDRQQYLVVPR